MLIDLPQKYVRLYRTYFPVLHAALFQPNNDWLGTLSEPVASAEHANLSDVMNRSEFFSAVGAIYLFKVQSANHTRE